MRYARKDYEYTIYAQTIFKINLRALFFLQ